MNFEFIKPVPGLGNLYETCKNAELLALNVPAMSCVSSRSALEFIVRLIYRSVVGDDHGMDLFSLVTDEDFVRYINDQTIIDAIHVVRVNGNNGAHGRTVTAPVACQTLEQLQYVLGETLMNMNEIDDYPSFVSPLEVVRARRASRPTGAPVEAPNNAESPAVAEPAALVTPLGKDGEHGSRCSGEAIELTEEVVARFAPSLRKTKFVVTKGHDPRENRKLYLDALLCEGGWKIALNANQQYPETASIDMTLDDGTSVDYVLCGRDGRPLAVVEYSADEGNPLANRERANHAVDMLEKKYGYRPTAYYSTGYRLFCIDPLGFPPRRVAGFHTIDELELLKQRVDTRADISNPVIDDAITNRDYQKEAIKNVCNAFMNGRRRSVVVMATGTGKTRVAISLVDVLLRGGWIKNVLFLADRTSLVRQAHKNFTKLLPNITTSIISGGSLNRDLNARIIFSTYQTMIKKIDEDSRDFSIGRFDLVIIDEAHRSIFGKYRALFEYFDSLMVGLTATPRSEEFKSTFEMFGAENGEPDYAYELEQAVHDCYLVGYTVLDRTTEALRHGIVYDDLSVEDKEKVDSEFGLAGDGADDSLSQDLSGSVIKLSGKVINKSTIDVMLGELMENGIKVDAGDKLGKTIIFAKSHYEALMIAERFNVLFPNEGVDFCKCIDSQIDGALELIDSFSERDKMPQVAVSVDMLDTGIDVPDAVNLVFFKATSSKIKFLQMLGRGTRLSPDLFGPGDDKTCFYCFDFYDNFRYFGTTSSWSAEDGFFETSKPVKSASVRINELKFDIFRQLLAEPNLSGFDKTYFDELYSYFSRGVADLNNDAFEVNRNIAYVNKYRAEDKLLCLDKDEVDEFKTRVLPLLPRESCSLKVKSFDALVLTVESEYKKRLDEGKDPATIRFGLSQLSSAFSERMRALLKLKTIPAVMAKEQLITSMMSGEYLLSDFSFERAEYVRKELRGLMNYIQADDKNHVIDLPDHIIDNDERTGFASELNYADKVGEYLQSNNDVALAKLRALDVLTPDDIEALKRVFTLQLGTAGEFASWAGVSWGDTAALAFLRKHVGLSDVAVEDRLGSILHDERLNDNQALYLNQMVDYARVNGDITTRVLLDEAPFKGRDLMGLFGQELFPLVKQVVNIIHGALG